MFQFDVTHLASVTLGALLGAVALWAANRRKRRQRAASAPEGILRAELNLATQIAGIGVWRMDIATGVTTIDASLQRMLGLEDDLGGGRIPVHPDDRERTNGALHKAMHETADVVSLRMRIVQRSGKVRHFQTHFRKLRGPGQGEVIGVSRDITDEVEQAEHARVLAERLNIATEAAGISCWELDLQTRRFLWIENPLLDTSSAEPNASLDSYRQRMHAADRLNVEALLAAALESGQERISYHYRIVSNNGKLLYVQIHARFIRRTNTVRDCWACRGMRRARSKRRSSWNNRLAMSACCAIGSACRLKRRASAVGRSTWINNASWSWTRACARCICCRTSTAPWKNFSRMCIWTTAATLPTR